MVRFFGMSIFPSKKVVKGKQQPREISSLTIQIVGIFLATVGILCLLSILTFSPTDPVLLFSNASPDGVPNNAVGLMGSTAAFSLFTVVGGGAFVVPLLFVGFGTQCPLVRTVEGDHRRMGGIVIGHPVCECFVALAIFDHCHG